MKTMYLMLCVTTILQCSCAQQNKITSEKDSDKKPGELIAAKQFKFTAQTATPMSGRVIQLTSQYDVQLKNDTLIAFLPYFGRAFTAPLDPSKGGIQFTSHKFSYNARSRKKGGWELTIKPEDASDIQTLMFSVAASGYATLQVTSNSRQPISFYGNIGPNPLKNNQ